MKPYRLPLKVCDTNGKQIIAFITQRDVRINVVEIAQIEAVRKDNPPFATNGTIRFSYERKKQQSVVKKVTKYLEDLFLKELSNDGSNNSGDASLNNSGGSKVKTKPGAVKKSKGKSSGTVHGSRGGTKQSGSGGATSSPDLAKSSDSEGHNEG